MLQAPEKYHTHGAAADKVFTAVCRSLIDPTCQDDWRGLQPLDWRMLLFMAAPDREGVGPLLYWLFERSGWPESIPKNVRHSLRLMYYNTMAHNTLLFSAYHDLCHAFMSAGLPFVPLKGVALSKEVYPDAGLRPMGDLDLLIPSQRAEEAVRIATDLGFTPAEAEIQEGINAELAYNAFLLGGEGRRIGLELHWNLMGGEADARRVPMDWFWQQVHAGEAGNLQLDETVHLLYLTAHLMIRHGGYLERLIWFVDLDRLIRGAVIEWDRFVQAAGELRWGAPARLALETAVQLFGTPVPPTLFGQLAGGSEWTEFLNQRQEKAIADTRFERTWLDMQHLSPIARLKYVFALVFPSFEYMRWRYRPANAFALVWAYPVRWMDILKDGGRFLANRL